jgi:response regulator of citrate/malate metabolism
MSTETAELILAVLNEQVHELSAQECADAIGVSRVSARRYLEHFVREGRVQVSLRYGSPGRPERRYLLSEKSG